MSYNDYDLLDLVRLVEKRVGGDSILALLSLLNRLGTTNLLLESLGLDDVRDAAETDSARVLVMGDSRISVDKLRSIVRSEGYDEKLFEYMTDYDKISNKSISRLRNSNYRAVIVGPMSHSIAGMEHASSGIEHMKSHPDVYPPVIEARNERGVLELNNNSFKKALAELENMYEIEQL